VNQTNIYVENDQDTAEKDQQRLMNCIGPYRRDPIKTNDVGNTGSDAQYLVTHLLAFPLTQFSNTCYCNHNERVGLIEYEKNSCKL
jgi:hypothetical protein